MRVASLPSTDESLNGLGYCAVMRCVELTKIIMAIYQHHEETLGAKAPRGLLLLSGIGDKQWKTAMKAREANSEELGYQYFNAVAVLASMSANVDAKLVCWITRRPRPLRKCLISSYPRIFLRVKVWV